MTCFISVARGNGCLPPPEGRAASSVFVQVESVKQHRVSQLDCWHAHNLLVVVWATDQYGMHGTLAAGP